LPNLQYSTPRQVGPQVRYSQYLRADEKANKICRHHLDIHDPQKASQYKCHREGCTYASRFPKDVRRHQLRHQKPKFHKFVCKEVGCTAKYHRNDYLLRHYRDKHPDSSSVLSTGSTAASRLGDGMSSTGSYLVVEALSDKTPGTEMSSFDMCLDPSLK